MGPQLSKFKTSFCVISSATLEFCCWLYSGHFLQLRRNQHWNIWNFCSHNRSQLFENQDYFSLKNEKEFVWKKYEW